MSEHKFTPGPWKYSFESIDPEWAVVTAPGGTVIANVNAHGRQEENARLITCAPDMLAVLQELQESASYWSEYDVPIGIVDRINSVISKATGATV